MKQTFLLHYWMNDLLCHLKYLEIYLITTLNARHHFVTQETTPFLDENRPPDHLFQIRMSHLTMKNPNSSTWGK
jgi:hypothetical protein